jgi:3-phenylpropionate/trans-cinnamate dioxygenase ferredoxin reductase subunit
MKTDVNAIVIIGAGLSGDTAAAALRTAGFQGSITLVSDEPHRPYDRPPLSKAALISADEAQKIFFHPATWYEEKNIALVLGDRAAHVDPRAHSVTLTSGRSLSYDKLLIATGTRARRLRLLENAGASIFYLRTLDDSEALRSLLKPGARLAIIGAGVIGMEVAASARMSGLGDRTGGPGDGAIGLSNGVALPDRISPSRGGADPVWRQDHWSRRLRGPRSDRTRRRDQD